MSSYTLKAKRDGIRAIDWSVGGVHWPVKTAANIVDEMSSSNPLAAFLLEDPLPVGASAASFLQPHWDAVYFYQKKSLRQQTHAWLCRGSDSEELSGEESVDEAETENHATRCNQEVSHRVQRHFKGLLEVGAIPIPNKSAISRWIKLVTLSSLGM